MQRTQIMRTTDNSVLTNHSVDLTLGCSIAISFISELSHSKKKSAISPCTEDTRICRNTLLNQSRKTEDPPLHKKRKEKWKSKPEEGCICLIVFNRHRMWCAFFKMCETVV